MIPLSPLASNPLPASQLFIYLLGDSPQPNGEIKGRRRKKGINMREK